MKQGIDVRISSCAMIVNTEFGEIGNHVAIDEFVMITTSFDIGSYVHIASHCSIIGGVEGRFIMKDFSGLAAGCRIICGTDDFKGEGLTNPTVPIEYRIVTHSTVKLEKHVTLGTNVIVHPDVTIGEGSVVGSCSLVTKNLDPWGIFIGIPARRVGDRRKDKILQYEELLMRANQ